MRISFLISESLTTTKCHGCLFAPEGALAAALTALVISSIGTASSEKFRTDLLELILVRKDYEWWRILVFGNKLNCNF